jgi:hypothetical protein
MRVSTELEKKKMVKLIRIQSRAPEEHYQLLTGQIYQALYLLTYVLIYEISN